MEQATLPFRDICANRHKGNRHSVAANQRIAPYKASDRERIKIQIAAAGFAGLTLKEIRIEHPTAIPRRFKFHNEFSGRLSRLKELHEVFESGRERDNCDVLVASWEWVTPEKKAELALRWLKENYRNGSAQ